MQVSRTGHHSRGEEPRNAPSPPQPPDHRRADAASQVSRPKVPPPLTSDEIQSQIDHHRATLRQALRDPSKTFDDRESHWMELHRLLRERDA